MDRKLILNLSLLVGQLFLGQSCTHNSHRVTAENTTKEITAVSISAIGGFTAVPSNGYTIRITRDSVYYLFSAIDTAHSTLKSYANTEDRWKLLLNKIDLEKFADAKEGESRQPYDGIDIKISIQAKNREYTKLNADNSPSWNLVYRQLEESFSPQSLENKKIDK